MLVWLTLPFYDFCGFRSVAVNSVYKLQFFTFRNINNCRSVVGRQPAFTRKLVTPEVVWQNCLAVTKLSGVNFVWVYRRRDIHEVDAWLKCHDALMTIANSLHDASVTTHSEQRLPALTAGDSTCCIIINVRSAPHIAMRQKHCPYHLRRYCLSNAFW